MIPKMYKAAFVIAILVLPLLSLAQTNSKESVTVTLSKPGKAFKLNLSLDKGNIKVLAYDGSGIEIVAEPEINKVKKAEPNQNQNNNTNTNTNTNINVHEKVTKSETKNTDGKYIIATETNNSVSIKPVSPSEVLNIVIKVPKTNGSFNFIVVYKGDVSVTDVTGEVEANTNNGSILLSNISGSAVAASLTGNIIATFKSVNEKSPMAFSSLVGKIDISFPASSKANLKLKTDNGQLLTDFDISDDNSKPDGKPEPKPNPNTINQPKFKLNNSGWVYGKINQGGPEIMMKNMQGNIYIRKGK